MVEAPLPGEPRLCVLAHLTPAQRRAYVLADNKLALNAGWDLPLVSLLYQKGRDSRIFQAQDGYDRRDSEQQQVTADEDRGRLVRRP